jgi:hypothetical protein
VLASSNGSVSNPALSKTISGTVFDNLGITKSSQLTTLILTPTFSITQRPVAYFAGVTLPLNSTINPLVNLTPMPLVYVS